MGFGTARAFVLALLVVSCLTVEAVPTEAPAHPPSYHHHPHPPAVAPAHPPHHHHHHHHHPPTPTPTPTPTPAPVHPPPKPVTPPPKPATPPPKPYTPPKPVTPPPKPATPPPKPYTPPPKPATPPPKPATPPPKPYTPPPKPATPPPKPYTPPKPVTPPPKPYTPPAKPPTPTKPPVHPPYVPPLRKMVAVQGVVYCKSCKYAGVNTLLNATRVEGAIVRLQCRNTKYSLLATGKTDKNGYFIIKPKFLTTYGVHKCKASLLWSPLPYCRKPSMLHGGDKGGILRPDEKSSSEKLPFVFYSVGPFAFEPKCTH